MTPLTRSKRGRFFIRDELQVQIPTCRDFSRRYASERGADMLIWSAWRKERYAEALLVATAPLARIRRRTPGNRVSRLHRGKRGHPQVRLRFATGSRVSHEQRTSAVCRDGP